MSPHHQMPNRRARQHHRLHNTIFITPSSRDPYSKILRTEGYTIYDTGEALLPGLDWTPNSARTILSHAHPSAQAGFLKTL